MFVDDRTVIMLAYQPFGYPSPNKVSSGLSVYILAAS